MEELHKRLKANDLLSKVLNSLTLMSVYWNCVLATVYRKSGHFRDK